MAAAKRRANAVAAGVEDPLLTEIVRRLADLYHPQRIYLFGSHARDAAGRDSDYDLMVVVSDDAPPALCRGGPGYTALWGLGAAADILVWRRTAFDERQHLRASLPATVVHEGRLVYPAPVLSRVASLTEYAFHDASDVLHGR
jgi:nucleotidyltransferase-like protein